MKQAKEIDAFVHQSFAMYGLDFKQFFGDLVDEEEDEEDIPYGGEYVELPIVINGSIDMELLARAAMTLGVETEALLSMDKKAVRYWYDKYPYFALRAEFDAARSHSRRFNCSPAEMVIEAIFDKDYAPEKHKRYKGNIKERLIELLKSYDAVMPGCYHDGKEILRLGVQTDNFTHFERISELAEAYLSMASRARDLFYRLWDNDLPEADVKEYNFLVSVLGMRDVGYSPAEPIYYDMARKFAPTYKQEGYSDYASYIMYRGADFPAFYACKEFYDDPQLIERMVQEFPTMKAEIGQMAVYAKNFLCSFVWSDDPEPPIEASFDEYLVGVLHSCGEDVPSWYHRVYVPKAEDELYGDAKYIAICEKLSAPASQGGLVLSLPECKQKGDASIKRVMARTMRGSQNGIH